MTQQITELVRGAPAAARGRRPAATWKEDLTAMTLAVWPVIALYFDGRNHNNTTGQESFWSLAHIVLYAGMSVFALYVTLLILRYQARAGVNLARMQVDLRAIPVGYGVALIGLITLGIGGPLDFIWHSAYGFEVNVDAIYSPPHLLLFSGALLVSTTGIRSMWAKRDIVPSWRRFLPVAISAILVIGVASFITMYLSAFMTNVTPTSDFVDDLRRFSDVRADQTVSMRAGLTAYGDDSFPYYYYTVSHGIASQVISTLVLIGPTLLLLRRWRLPAGAMTVILLAFGLMVSIWTEYDDALYLIPLVLTGLTIDLLQRFLARGPDARLSLGAIRLVGPAASLVLWGTYYIALAIDHGMGWHTTLWVGALMVSVLTGFGLSFLVAPPAYGPRLVEGEDDIDDAEDIAEDPGVTAAAPA